MAFAIFAYVIGLWMLANFVGANYKNDPVAVIGVKLDFFTGSFLVYLFWNFSAVILDQARESAHKRLSFTNKKLKKIFLAVTPFAAIATQLPVVLSITPPNGGELRLEYGVGFPVYAGLLGILIVAGFCNFITALRVAKGSFKQQLNVMLLGFIVGAVVLAFANLVLPQLSSSKDVNQLAGNIAYFGIVFLLFTIFYAIGKHRLFDLRLLVARSVVYLLSIGSLVLIFTGVSYSLLQNVVFQGQSISSAQSIAFTSLAVLLALAFQPLKKSFDKLSNKYFYRDAYDGEALLTEVNKVVVSNVDVDILLKKVSEIIVRNLKTDFAVFDVYKTAYLAGRVIGDKPSKYSRNDIEEIDKFMAHSTERIVTALDIQETHPDARSVFQTHNVEVAAKLNPFSEHGSSGYGLLLIGAKKSGNQFTRQDLNVIRIISGELSIAVQNALRFEEIEQFNFTLQEKVNDATRKLRRTNEKLEAMDETKDEFISMASHQLRTPLTSVKGYVSMVLEGDAGQLNDMQRKLLEQAFTSSQRMVFLIADLLNLSRLRTGKFIIEAAPTNLADVIESEVSQLKETAASRSLKLLYKKPADFPSLMLDETKIRQVIMNFVDNAIYYTPAGGTVEIKLKQTDKSVEFTVSDDGIGVPKEDQHHLFNKFYRARNAQKARPDGTGLGLFMAKKVIVGQGGAIIFNSSEGKGSIFGFTFRKDKLLAPTK